MRAVKLEMTDGSKPAFAIQLEGGGFLGQVWTECPNCRCQLGRKYPTWKTLKAAEKHIAKLKADSKSDSFDKARLEREVRLKCP